MVADGIHNRDERLHVDDLGYALLFRIAAGDLEARSGIDDDREEIGNLAQALDRMAAEGACPPARLLVPTGADASAFPHLAVEEFGRLRGQAWEQAELPFRARGSVLVSLGNTAPLLAGPVHEGATTSAGRACE